MFQIESIKDNTVTVRYGVLTFKVYVSETGFVEIPKRVWIDKEQRKELIYSVSAAFYAEKNKRSVVDNEECWTERRDQNCL